MFAKMKNIILLTTLLFTVYFSNAQTPEKTGDSENSFRLGLQFTPTIGFIKSDKKVIKSGGSGLGYNFGLTGDFKFADNYYFATGIDVIYSTLKLNYVETLHDTSITPLYNQSDVLLKYKLQYLGIPLSLKLKTKEIHYIKYYGQFGMEPQFNIKKKVNANKGRYNDDNYYAPSETVYTNFDDDISFIRLGLIVGGGVEYSLGGKTSLVGGVFYNGGFTDINKDAFSKITNSYIALNLGVLF
jgi:hypothetical protein